MQKVTGIGGVFFKATDPKALAQWYQKHLGIEFGDQLFFAFDNPGVPETTAFSFFKEGTTHFLPSEKPFMINLRVKNLVELLTELKKENVQIAAEMQEFDEYGKFGWIMDPEGNKIELWEPIEDKK
ncbi:MAG TPA: VOC family protein [Puia sp.]|jgi:predicted enzyme related to lactoylglutathione lyase|nr:VOC family protein [Puia sp.]